ncbi:MAG: hypothetical protein A3J83_07285 [Elusimicrobia bacterium RIFOXYA2_FULL_40_6]|nr:MAG: hypothetical protein A3J83_07285 [Elusimicrobia bacterium RIFOXYA2_FULL_40_6]
MKYLIKKYWKFSTLCLSALFVFHVVFALIWLKIDTRPASYDQTFHLLLSYGYFDVVKVPSHDILIRLMDVSKYYPPVYHLCIVPFHFLFGISGHNFIFVNLFFLSILFFTLYKIGKTLYSRETGLLAAVVFSSVAFFLHCLYNCLIELSLTAMIMLSIYLYFKTDNFQSRKYTLLLSFAAATGMLVKWSYAFFVVIPLVYYICLRFNNIFMSLSGSEKKILLFNLVVIKILFLFFMFVFPFFVGNFLFSFLIGILAIGAILFYKRVYSEKYYPLFNFLLLALIVALFAGPWFFRHFFQLISKYQWIMEHAILVEKKPELFSLSAFLYYPQTMLFYFSIYHIPMFIAGLAVFFIKWKPKNKTLLIWILPGLLVITFITNKDSRFMMPLFPLLALISVHWIDYLKNFKIKKTAIFAVVIISAASYFTSAFYPLKFQYQMTRYICLPRPEPAVKEDWKEKFCIENILSNINQGDKYAKVVIFSNHPCFHKGVFDLYEKEHKRSTPELFFHSFEGKLTELTDFIIYKTGEKGLINYQEQYQAEASILNKDKYFSDTFAPVAQCTLPDNTTAIIYKLQPKPLSKLVSINGILNLVRKHLTDYGLSDSNVTAKLIPISPESTKRGEFKSIIINAPAVELQGIRINNFSLKIKDVGINMPALIYDGKLVFTKIREIEPSFSILASDLKESFEKRKNVFSLNKLDIKGGNIEISGTASRIPLDILVKMKYDAAGRVFRVEVERVKITKYITIPKFIYENEVSRKISFAPAWASTFSVKINGFSADNGKIEVN